MTDHLYKDCSLQETIENVQRALNAAGIEVEESYMQGAEGAFSVRVNITGTALGTNGKGTSKEIALASAYGELMERMQQFALYKFSFPVRDMGKFAFQYAPDEKKHPMDELCEYGALLQDAYRYGGKKQLELLSKEEKNGNFFYTLPYQDLLADKEIELPAMLVERIYASNGMAAGNTLEEALVQGLSELYERFANKRVGMQTVIPPVIPADKVPFTENARKIYDTVCAKGQYMIQFRDCSLGMGLPVIEMDFIDRQNGKYFVKYGAHPILEVAIERTLTELFQGRKLMTASMWMQRFSFEEIGDQEHNFEKIYRSGDGQYPYGTFSREADYEFTDCWFQGEYRNNGDLLDYCLDIAKKNGFSIYYKDFSFMALHAIHIIIPEMSDIVPFDEKYVDKMNAFKKAQALARNVAETNADEKRAILDFIAKSYYAPTDTVLPLYGLPMAGDAELAKCNVEYYKYLLYATIQEPENALQALDTFIGENGYRNNPQGAYYRCLREVYLGKYINHVSIEKLEPIAKLFYGEEVVNRVMADVDHQEEQLKTYSFPCAGGRDCTQCSDRCRYPEFVALHCKLTELCSNNWEKRNEQ